MTSLQQDLSSNPPRTTPIDRILSNAATSPVSPVPVSPVPPTTISTPQPPLPPLPTPPTISTPQPPPLQPTEAETIGENQNPIITLFNIDFDVDTILVSLLIFFIWVVIWQASGLWKLLRYNWIFGLVFFLFILYTLTNIVTAGTTSGGVVYELNILLTVEQMISILLGSVILFTLFSKNLPTPEGCNSIVFKLLMSNVVILMISSLWVNVITTGRAFRFVRKFKQGVYNITLTFLIIVGIIYIKGINGEIKCN
jgi:hypothetical protein